MQKINKKMSRSHLAIGLLSVLVGITGTGCQSMQPSWLGAQNSNKAGLTERQQSLAQTPIAKANSNRESIEQPNPLASVESAKQKAPVQRASANLAQSPTDQIEAIQPAVYSPGSLAASSSVVPVQYTQPAAKPRPTSNLNVPKYQSIGQSKGSENIPRIAMGPTMVQYQEPMPGGAPNIPRTNMASYARPNGHASSGCGCPSCNHGTGAYQPMYPRFSGNQGCGSCGQSSCSGECGGAIPETAPGIPRSTDPQEFIFDGGDQDPKVRLRDDLSQVGLDAEDTVIQYQTLDGKTNVESGCRVAIYAPRFASVRKRTSTKERDVALRLQATTRPDGPGTIRDQLPTAKVSLPIKAARSENVRVVEAFRERNRPVPAGMVLPMVTLSDSFKPYEDFSLIRNGDIRTTDLAKLAKSAAAARSWTNVDELNVLIDGKEAIEATGSKRTADVTIYEHKGARIRLCKVASEQMANPGDVISFTIRFDNTGEQPLNSLVITDSLAPRLEYVEQSQQASIPARFSTTPNSAGSSVLRWELEEGLKPGDGGLVRFSCKVR